MNSWKVALIDQTTGAVVPPDELQQIADACQQQVDYHLAPAWGVRADISVLASDDAVPPGTWPVKVVDSLTDAGGVHLDDQGQPYAEAVNGPQLSIGISHELLEMLVDPWGDRFTPAADVDPNHPGRQVFYLVEVCDPCEVSSYSVEGVQVSDFILPSFYEPDATRPVDYLNTLAGPLPERVPPNCYISWIDPADGKWHQQTADGVIVTADMTHGRNPRDDRDSAFGDTDRHNIPAIYGASSPPTASKHSSQSASSPGSRRNNKADAGRTNVQPATPMAGLEFSLQDISSLVQKLQGIQQSLSQQEHMLLLAIFAAAADRVTVSDPLAGTATLPVAEIRGETPGAGGLQATLGDLRQQLLNAYIPGNYFDSVSGGNEKIVGMR